MEVMEFRMDKQEWDFGETQILELVRKSYLEGQASFGVVPGKCALLVIDMQDEFARPGWTPYWVPEATRQVPRVKQLIEWLSHTRVVPNGRVRHESTA